MDQDTRVRLAWDGVMAAYHEEILGPFHPDVGPTRFHDRLRTALTVLGARAGARPLTVLDAGCGPGNLLPELASLDRSLHVVGVDTAAPGLDLAAARAGDLGLAADFIDGDLATLDLGRRFDVVVAVNSILPVRSRPDPRAAVARILERLAAHLLPDGRFIAVLPAHDCLLADLAWVAKQSATADSLRRLHREYAVDLRHRLGDTGFGVPQCMHDEVTIGAELPAAGLRLRRAPEQLRYPDEVAARHYPSGDGWDWLIEAELDGVSR